MQPFVENIMVEGRIYKKIFYRIFDTSDFKIDH